MEKYLKEIFNNCSAKLDYLENSEISFSVPNISTHGDLSTNIALILAANLNRKPRTIAEEILSNLDFEKEKIEKIEIAGPGFLNFYFNPKFVTGIIKDILNNKTEFGRSRLHLGKRAIVEFVSANPTGPLTVGHGRNAVLGDTVSSLLEWVGYEVDREYYFNNAGRQMRVLGDSVKIRYRQSKGEDVAFPEDYYQGEYIKDIAERIKNELEGTTSDEQSADYFKSYAEKEIFDDIKKTLHRIKIHMNTYFNEFDLYENKNIERLLEILKEKKLSYEKDGAVWLKLTSLGMEEDKVIIKSTGEPTYRLPDIAYHLTKFDRKYDLIVDIFGSDHAATYPDVLAGVKALGRDISKVVVLIHQFVTILEKGEVVKMSTRKANFITLDELIDEVGPDVVRYFFNMRNMSGHLNFDLEIAKKQSDENPVFYLQYAHARICSILRLAAEENLSLSIDHLDLLTADSEQSLMKKMYRFQDEIIYAAEHFEPNRISTYLEELASLFHKFYTECRIIGSETRLAGSRIALCVAVKTILNNGLSILGVEAPERM